MCAGRSRRFRSRAIGGLPVLKGRCREPVGWPRIAALRVALKSDHVLLAPPSRRPNSTTVSQDPTIFIIGPDSTRKGPNSVKSGPISTNIRRSETDQLRRSIPVNRTSLARSQPIRPILGHLGRRNGLSNTALRVAASWPSVFHSKPWRRRARCCWKSKLGGGRKGGRPEVKKEGCSNIHAIGARLSGEN